MSNVEAIKKADSAPDRIWATVNGMSTRLPDGVRQLVGGWSQDAGRSGAVEYVRASTLEALQRENETLRQALKPFSDHAGGLFQINFNRNDEVSAVETKDCFIFSIKAGAFFDARTALASAGEHHAK